jgi:hypothetical protein
MGRAKDDFIEKTGGFMVGEPSPMLRYQIISELEDKLKTGKLSREEVDGVTARIHRLKGMPSDEWRTYEEDNDKD